MKITSRKRKLKYIREKNHYRLGGRANSFFKISDETLEDIEFAGNVIEQEGKEAIQRFERKFKMEFGIADDCKGIFMDDFINDVTTVKFSLKVVN